MNQETNSTLQFAEDFPRGTRQLEELKAPLWNLYKPILLDAYMFCNAHTYCIRLQELNFTDTNILKLGIHYN